MIFEFKETTTWSGFYFIPDVDEKAIQINRYIKIACSYHENFESKWKIKSLWTAHMKSIFPEI